MMIDFELNEDFWKVLKDYMYFVAIKNLFHLKTKPQNLKNKKKYLDRN